MTIYPNIYEYALKPIHLVIRLETSPVVFWSYSTSGARENILLKIYPYKFILIG